MICSSMMNAELLNQQLRELYSSHFDDIVRIRDENGLSDPILINASQSYVEAQHKIIFVGKETFGWSNSDSRNPKLIDELMEVYSKFNMAEGYHSSPFWRAIRKFETELNYQPYSSLFTNISKMDFEGGEVPYESRLRQNKIPLLKSELEILQPDLVIFFTSHHLDDLILSQLPQASKGHLNGYEQRIACKINGMKFKSFRTYHPNYLVRSKQTEVYNTILENY